MRQTRRDFIASILAASVVPDCVRVIIKPPALPAPTYRGFSFYRDPFPFFVADAERLAGTIAKNVARRSPFLDLVERSPEA